ncbi:MAG: MmgE/PrpD family protein [Treponema sp.]|nr:MmgE/PrpD family protein [Treponema sp.]
MSQNQMNQENNTVSEGFAKFILDVKFGNIPKDLVSFIKVLTLKCIADMAAGAGMPHSRKLVNPVRERRLPGDVGVMTYGFKTSLWEGVFLNSFFAHAAELEDDAFFDADFNSTGPSWSITVIPLLLTFAERQRLSGKQLIEAIVAGLEIHRRSCLTHVAHRGVLLGQGSIGPVAGAAKALGLNREEILSAMGLAISGPDVQIVNYGYDGHFFESAMQTMHAMIAAEMAKNGLTGNPDLSRFLSLKYGDTSASSEKMLADLGTRWLCRDFWIKKYPASFGLHSTIDIMVELKNKHNINWKDIDTIEVFPANGMLCYVPKDVSSAVVSQYWVLAVAAVDGDVTIDHMTEDALVNPDYREVMARIRHTCPSGDNSIQQPLFSHKDSIKICMKNGLEYTGERQYPIGSPMEPLTDKQMKDLFAKFSAKMFSPQNCEKIAGMVLNLENLNDIDELMDLLTYRNVL